MVIAAYYWLLNAQTLEPLILRTWWFVRSLSHLASSSLGLVSRQSLLVFL